MGAGASVDFGLPSGRSLKSNVQNECRFRFSDYGKLESGDPFFYEQLAKQIGKRNIIPISKTLVRALPSFPSIDDFLFSHSHDERMVKFGKMAIARVIARAEQTSIVKQLAADDFGAQTDAEEHIREQTWIGTFIQLLATGVPRSEVESLFNDVTIISFNYDRCVECVLYHMVQAAFGIDGDEATKVMHGLRIIRPYGGLGALHCSGELSTTPFGPSLNLTPELSQRIRVYTENTEDNSELASARLAIANARNVVFLGFGYHKQNMRLLKFDHATAKPTRVYATSFREPQPTLEAISTRVRKSIGCAPVLPGVDTDCTRFFREYGTLLAG